MFQVVRFYMLSTVCLLLSRGSAVDRRVLTVCPETPLNPRAGSNNQRASFGSGVGRA